VKEEELDRILWRTGFGKGSGYIKIGNRLNESIYYLVSITESQFSVRYELNICIIWIICCFRRLSYTPTLIYHCDSYTVIDRIYLFEAYGDVQQSEQTVYLNVTNRPVAILTLNCQTMASGLTAVWELNLLH
jgi:hypothetical protein